MINIERLLDKNGLEYVLQKINEKYATKEDLKRRTYTLYAFHINGNESDPSSKVTYLEDARGMTPAHMNYSTGKFDYGSWEDAFFMPRPCAVLQTGTVDYYLNPDNYAQKADGTASDITNTSYAGNFMVEWGKNGKRIYYKVVPDKNDVTSGTVYISDEKVDPDFHDWSFINNQGVEVDHFYTPIYNGSVVSNVMRSLSGQAVSKNLTAQQEIDACKLNNKTSDVLWFNEVLCDRILINFLLILIGKSTDTQTVFGRGLDTGGETAFNNYTTGALNNKGLFCGYNDGTHAVKVFGMENYWGFQWRRTSGYMLVDGDQRIKLTYGNQDGSVATAYNTTGENYISIGITPTGTSGGYIDVMNFNEYGMFGKSLNGSATTHYCDGLYFNTSGIRFTCFSGSSSDGVRCGAFNVALSGLSSRVGWDVGTSLSFKPLS